MARCRYLSGPCPELLAPLALKRDGERSWAEDGRESRRYQQQQGVMIFLTAPPLWSWQRCRGRAGRPGTRARSVKKGWHYDQDYDRIRDRVQPGT